MGLGFYFELFMYKKTTKKQQTAEIAVLTLVFIFIPKSVIHCWKCVPPSFVAAKERNVIVAIYNLHFLSRDEGFELENQDSLIKFLLFFGSNFCFLNIKRKEKKVKLKKSERDQILFHIPEKYLCLCLCLISIYAHI